MKIEMAVPTLMVAGMEVMVARLGRQLAARGHEVGISCVEAGGPLVPELAAAGVNVQVLEAHGFVGLEWLRRLSTHFQRRAPDVLHVHSGCWFKSALAGRRAGISPIVHTAHGFVPDMGWKEKLLDRAAASLTNHIVAVSEHLTADLISRGIPRDKISVIENGIDTTLFQIRRPTGFLRARLAISPTACIVGTVARLEPIKNQAMLIEAIALARQSGCDCEAVLIGDGSLRLDLERYCRERGVADKVHFWGMEPNVASIYPELDIFALTSTAEGTSISLLEAMASGVCPLVTAVGGNVALLDDGQCGTLVGTRQAAQMARAIGELALDADRRRATGGKARERVLARFSETAMIESYEALYLSS